MRPLVILALLALCAVAHGQDQEGKLLQRIMSPDMTMTSQFQGRGYYGGADKGNKFSKEANVKEFDFVQKFSAKSFDAKSYDAKSYDAKSFWQGDFQYSTKQAPVKESSNAGKVFETKGEPVKESANAEKQFVENGKGYSDANKQSKEEGKTSQNHLNEQKNASGKMDIDQVRDLLNKPPL